MPNTDYTDYRVIFIIWTDNVNYIRPATISFNIELLYCFAVFPRLYPHIAYMPSTHCTDYPDYTIVFIIWTDNVNAICSTTISFNMQLWYYIAVFPRLYPHTTYMPNTDYIEYIVVFIIWTENVNAICPTTFSLNIQLWYCIAAFQRLYPHTTHMRNTDYTDYAGYRIDLII